MRTLGATTIAAKNADRVTPIYLYTVQLDESTTLYLAENVENVTWSGQVYTAFPIAHDKVEVGGTTIPGMTLTVSNVNLAFMQYCRTYELRGCPVTVTIVLAEALADTVPCAQDTFWIDTYTITDEAVAFTLSSVWSLDITIPTVRFTREDFPQMPRSRTVIG